MKTKPIVLILFILAAAAAGIFWFADRGEASGNNQAPSRPTVGPAVQVYTVKPTDLEDKLILNGSIRGEEGIDLRPEIQGRVVEILFTDGSDVQKGDLLVRLDDSELQAELNAITLQLELAEQKAERQEQLYKRGLVSEEEYDTVLNEREVLRARQMLLKARIEKTAIRAPFSGRIGLRLISPGQIINPETKITTLQQLDPLLVDFSVPERYQTQLQIGVPLTLRVTGIQETLPGTVVARDPVVNSDTRTITLRGKVPNKNGLLYPGNFAIVELNLSSRKNTILVPALSVVRSLNGASVFVVENGVAQRRIVETGLRTRETVEIIRGLKSGEKIIVRGIEAVRDGQEVRVVDELETLENQ